MSTLPRQTITADGIGASEIAAAIGLNKYKSPIELWLEKTGQRAPFAGNRRTDWGLDVEGPIREWYVREHCVAVFVPSESLFHPEVPWMRGTPDGIALRDADRPPTRENWSHGFEAKNVHWRSGDRWGDPGSDQVPMEYLLQATQNLAVTDLDRWDVVPSIGGAPPEVYTVHRDEELIDLIVDQGGEFWSRVVNQVPPEIDAGEAWAVYLAERYPWTSEAYVDADERAEFLVGELHEIRNQIDELDKKRSKVENEIRALIGPNAGLESSFGRVTWKPSAPRKLVDWPGVAAKICEETGYSPEKFADLMREFTRLSKASRPLRTPARWSRE